MRKRNFTLIEILTVIVIIAILASITIGGINYASSKAEHDKTVAAMMEFMEALENYKNDYGSYPLCPKISAEREAVKVDFSDPMWSKFINDTPNKRKRSYLEGADGEYLDAFGNQFWYQFPAPSGKDTNKYILWSMGKDEKHGKNRSNGPADAEHAGEKNSDDICSWKEN